MPVSICSLCGDPHSPGQLNHPDCVAERIRDLEAALLCAETALHNAALSAGEQSQFLAKASMAAYKIRDR